MVIKDDTDRHISAISQELYNLILPVEPIINFK